ncbi:very-long-chain enoyl-CoA reductase [Elysia marginata]|uniref:Very-long-chain enoyl-CoA reductase n=1 Tax=Elysia marginata TaxID=1093978 RepID=A0AAV4GTD8_9GAST|nr:very-long-chain enoyl-CoA reductase [Elysia marginata]
MVKNSSKYLKNHRENTIKLCGEAICKHLRSCEQEQSSDWPIIFRQDEKAEMISPFQGEPKPLEKPITPEEVRKSFNSLNNNKAPGEDEIHAELLKYGTPLLDQTIADIFNTTFNKHEKIDINRRVLIAIQKPGKNKGPPNNL